MASSDSVVTRDPDLLGGTPVFRGTRVPLVVLFDYFEGDKTLNEFLDDFPTVTRDAAIRALEHAKSLALGAVRKQNLDPAGGLGTELAALFPKDGPDFVIQELRGYTIESPFEPSPRKTPGLRPADSRGRLSPHKPSRKPSGKPRKKRA